jgi:hypothetical protein
MSNVRTKDSFSAPSGISRAWISKVCPAADGQAQGTPEALQVAERAVLNSCVLNRYDGGYLRRLTGQFQRGEVERRAHGRRVAGQWPRLHIELYAIHDWSLRSSKPCRVVNGGQGIRDNRQV